MSSNWTSDVLALRITPVVFGVLFCLGAWSELVDVFGLGIIGFTRWSFIIAAAAMIASAVRPMISIRFVALAFGCWAPLARGLTLIIEGQELVPRKSELIGGGVWISVSYMVLFVWLVTVPTMAWHRER